MRTHNVDLPSLTSFLISLMWITLHFGISRKELNSLLRLFILKALAYQSKSARVYRLTEYSSRELLGAIC